MKSLVLTIFCLWIVGNVKALRLRGEAYPGIENVNVKVPLPKMYQEPELRIVGGEIATEAYAPYLVSLQNQYGNHFCGGVIIDNKYILTAGSCVAGLDKRHVKVVTGTNDWMGPAWEYNVDEIIIHCSFDKPLYHNDIALLKLSGQVAYDDKTKNITLAKLDELEEGEMLTMTGWGSTELGQYYPDNLNKLDARFISNDQCQALYAQYADDVDIGHLCVLSQSGSGACHGDTGSPLVNSKGQLVGIGNWGVPCALGFPDVFAKISFYIDWIETTIKGCKLKT